jgi:hypothetical protein
MLRISLAPLRLATLICGEAIAKEPSIRLEAGHGLASSSSPPACGEGTVYTCAAGDDALGSMTICGSSCSPKRSAL